MSFTPTDRGALLSGLRRPSQPYQPRRSAPPIQQTFFPIPRGGGGGGGGGRNYLQQQQQNEFDLIRQTNEVMELQLQQMRLQSLEIQERILAAAASTRSDPFGNQRGWIQPMSAGYIDRTFPPSQSALEERRDALAGLQRAQRNRTASQQHGPPQTASVDGRFSQRQRLPSFDSIESLHQSPSPTSPPSPSLKTGQSSPTGPTLVLSKPGDAYPSPPLSIKGCSPPSQSHHQKSDSESSTNSSELSERSSFESNDTSILSSSSPLQLRPKLNPTAAIFNPLPQPPRQQPQQPQQQQQQQRFFSLIEGPRSIVIRQPKGPVNDEELIQKNFALRIRKRAILSLLRPSQLV